ncbi:hypothetical protein BA6E_121514 [Bacteroidales bacterium 6E]|nr:hypothetical protein BA6E_121514 [Bacteroidales bacterium 6E]
MKKILLIILVGILGTTLSISAQRQDRQKGDTLVTSSLVNGLKFRSIGPAWASGRIADLAVNPGNPSEYYAAVASGNVWKTENNGTTWKPIFDNYGAYATGVVKIDPNNYNVVWVGTGENNHQRALGYGDGVYKSTDGGKSFKNMGLKQSRQIGGIVIDPRSSDIVFVACEGSAWGPGGERGLYKTADGGKTWEKVLNISDETGVNNVVLDPSNPDIMYATSEQRRRHVFSKIGGGPESAVYKSTDGGTSWNKTMKGLPSGDIGSMGIDVSPVDPNVVYLIVEAAGNSGGFFRSTDKGESWEKMNSYHSSGQYYNKIHCDPKDVDRVISLDTYTQITEDGGKTWRNLGNSGRHVDDHALWIDPSNTRHIIIGGDGGIYETWDNGSSWDFKENLPVTQFYRVNVDNAYPFYNVYGGTQDNNSMYGPSANLTRSGVTNDEWIVTMGGDGFWIDTDPEDHNIVYTEYQYGNLSRYDKRSGEAKNIKPRERKGEETYKWNWNAPMFVSKHHPKRIYFAANKVFRSDNRGDSWEVISDDLTTKTDRNTWPVMGKFWSIDAVAKDVSTSLWGTIVALAESPLNENLLYAGTDDGVISITEDGGKNWRQVKNFPGVPEYTYVSHIHADKFNENIVYASFDNLKRDDFKPYILKSTDKGKSWSSISSNMPENGTVHSLEQDFINSDLLFAGTEFGVFFSKDGGSNWVQLKAGIPTIAVRHMAIQKRECDLVLATFGRGFYILDDYSPLRDLNNENLDKEAHLFPIKDALLFNPSSNKDNQGDTYYTAPNPEFGVTFTYFLKEAPKSSKALRTEEEKKLFKDGKPIPQPTWRELELEGMEESSHLIFTIRDTDGNIIRRITQNPSKGINRVNWDLRYNNPSATSVSGSFNPIAGSSGRRGGGSGLLVMPGEYTVDLALWHQGELKQLAGSTKFLTKKPELVTLPAANYRENIQFAREVSRLSVAMTGTTRLTNEMISKIEHIKQAIYATPEADQSLMDKARVLGRELEEINFLLNGVQPKASREETPPAQVPLNIRLSSVSYGFVGNLSAITATEKESLAILKEEFPPVLEKLTKLVETDIPSLEEELTKLNAPWTPGRMPVWNK